MSGENQSDEVKRMLEQFRAKVGKELGESQKEHASMAMGNPQTPKKIESRQYLDFKKELLPTKLNIYEKMCNTFDGFLKLKPNPEDKKTKEMQEAIGICHLNVTPGGVQAFGMLAPLLSAIILSLLSYVVFQSMFFIVIFMLAGIGTIQVISKIPFFLSNSWRQAASNQMVMSVFYVVTYMRHTSNLELAIDFAAEHLSPPLSLDLKKVLWDVETEKYSSMTESMDAYLETWRKWNPEFIEAFHLIESSLNETSEERRVQVLDKSLSVMLEETFNKMLRYAHNLSSPITMLHMLGVIMPILGLVILPLLVSFMDNVAWYHISIIYNVAIPFGVYFLGKNILSTRPSGYGSVDISKAPGMEKYKKIIIPFGKSEISLNPLYFCLIIGGIFLLIGILPLILRSDFCLTDEGITPTYQMDADDARGLCFLDYHQSKPDDRGNTELIGPFGIGASMLSMFVVMALGFTLGLYYKLTSGNVIKIRDETVKLEEEFTSALFQLGNRIGDGLPVELAFGKVAEAMQGSRSADFFSIVSNNIRRLGQGVEDAIFNPKNGALTQYPSKIIESSMKVLTESSKKGPSIAAQAVINVSEYIQQIHRVNDRLNDLLADIVSSMRSQISFLTPAISGIVIGITSMVTYILGQLSGRLAVQQSKLAAGGAGALGGGGGGMMDMFGDGIPTYYFQIVVGIYVVQIIYILTIMSVGIESGQDKLQERFMLGKNLTKSVIMYCLIAAGVILMFNMIASQILTKGVG